MSSETGRRLDDVACLTGCQSFNVIFLALGLARWKAWRDSTDAIAVRRTKALAFRRILILRRNAKLCDEVAITHAHIPSRRGDVRVGIAVEIFRIAPTGTQHAPSRVISILRPSRLDMGPSMVPDDGDVAPTATEALRSGKRACWGKPCTES